jgi:hypothetical protein
MRRALILLLPLAALFPCVPWWFSEANGDRILGFPVWGAYAIGAAAGFAALVAVLVGRYWEMSASGDGLDDDSHDDAADR